MLGALMGTGLSAYTVVIVLEFILALYSIALAANTKNKILKIVHIAFCVLWVVLAILNIITI